NVAPLMFAPLNFIAELFVNRSRQALPEKLPTDHDPVQSLAKLIVPLGLLIFCAAFVAASMTADPETFSVPPLATLTKLEEVGLSVIRPPLKLITVAPPFERKYLGVSVPPEMFHVPLVTLNASDTLMSPAV